MNAEPPKSEKKRILLVEDEEHLAFSLQLNLESEGYEVVVSRDGRAALADFDGQGPFDLILLDAMLPEIDGFEVARRIRSRDVQTGILMLTVLISDEHRIRGLEVEVDDYLTKPFHLQELMLRIRRMARRSELFHASGDEPPASRQTFGPFTLDTERLILEGPTGRHELTALEADMLGEFIRHHGRVLSRQHLLERVWGVRGAVETRTVDNFVVRLRRYLEHEPNKPTYLLSVRGRGYRLVDPAP